MKIIHIAAATALLFAAGCNSKSKSQSVNADDQRKEALSAADGSDFMADSSNNAMESFTALQSKNGIEIGYFMNSQEFPDAELKEKKNPEINGGMVHFNYHVKNYELAKPTPGEAMCMCNKSPKGQHIHQILNNEPYEARYTDTFTSNLSTGRYLQLCFLSRSYHEGIKNGKAYNLSQFVVGSGSKIKEYDLKAPMLFYSRPKGEYKGEDTKNLLLDFFLVNTDLGTNGNKVKLSVDGTDFVLDKWAPYSLRGLKMGSHTIKLELTDGAGKHIDAPFNPVSRTIKLAD